jgi:hypothetical protein
MDDSALLFITVPNGRTLFELAFRLDLTIARGGLSSWRTSSAAHPGDGGASKPGQLQILDLRYK